jgi:hypothetical protein
MQFTVTYRQTTKNRRRCMICSRLVKDGELVFFKGARGRQGKAVHEDCRSDTGGDWYARDCAVTYQQQKLGNWTLVTDYGLQALQQQERQKADHIRERAQWKENGWTQEMLDLFDASYRATQDG